MEEQIKRVASVLKAAFGIYWLLPALIVIAGEAGNRWVGMYAGNAKATYWAETLVILLTALCVPASLKLFPWLLAHKVDAAKLPHALQLYATYSMLRLALLAVPAVTGLAAYYGMLSNNGMLCALIALAASLFCIPGEKRLRKELKIDGINE